MKRSTVTRIDQSRPGNLMSPKHGREVQAFDTAHRHPLALESKAAADSIDNLNQLMADTLTMRDLYKKHHWQVSGLTFYMLHLLFDKHAAEQSELADLVAERIQTLGGVTIAMAADVATATLIPRAPKGREDSATQIARLLHAHEVILKEARAMAREAAGCGDDGTNDILVSEVIRTNELQVWFLVEHTETGSPRLFAAK